MFETTNIELFHGQQLLLLENFSTVNYVATLKLCTFLENRKEDLEHLKKKRELNPGRSRSL